MALIHSIALDFNQNNLLEARCDQRPIDSTRKEMKIVLRFPRALNSGWLPSNPPDVNQAFNCRSDIGAVGVHFASYFSLSFYSMLHGQAYSISISPVVLRTDENLRKIAPKL